MEKQTVENKVKEIAEAMGLTSVSYTPLTLPTKLEV